MRDGTHRRSILRVGGAVASALVAGCLRLEQEGNGGGGGVTAAGSEEEAAAAEDDVTNRFYRQMEESQELYRAAVDDGIDRTYEATEANAWEPCLESHDRTVEILEEAWERSREANEVATQVDGEFGAVATRWVEIWAEILETHERIVSALAEICSIGMEQESNGGTDPDRIDEDLESLLEEIENSYRTLRERREELAAAIEETLELDSTADEWDVPRIDVRDPPTVRVEATDSGFEERFWRAMERSREHFSAASERTDRAIDAADAEAWDACGDLTDEAREELTQARRTATEAGEIADNAGRDDHVSAVERTMDLYMLQNDLIQLVRELCSAGEAGDEAEFRRHREEVDELTEEVAAAERELERTLDEL